jgi:hypothetical protein
LSPRTDRRTALRLAAAAALALCAASCTEYVEHRETIAPHAGNAVAANRAIHTVDPWPAASARTDIDTSGRRVVDAIERYEAGKPGNGSTPAPSVMAIPIGLPGGAAAAQ